MTDLEPLADSNPGRARLPFRGPSETTGTSNRSRSMNKYLLVLLSAFLFVVALGPGAPLAQEDSDFVVVIHAENPTTSIERGLLSKIFLKKAKRWENGVAVAPVDQAEQSAVREAFTRKVHKKSVSAIKSFWQRMIFSGRDVPPTELESDAEVLEFVAGEPGAVGYISASTELTDGVKELSISE